MKTQITFDRGCAEQILHVFGMKVGRGGFIYDSAGRQVRDCFFNKPLTIMEFGGLKKSKRGGLDVFANDIGSLIQFADSLPDDHFGSGDGSEKIGGTDVE